MQVNNLLIKELRQNRGWTQQHLADVIGLSLRTVQRIEKNGTTSLETISALSSVFEVERNKLVKEQNTVAKERLISPPIFLVTTFITGLFSGGITVYLLLKYF